jgi:L-lactate utilization protein LutC
METTVELTELEKAKQVIEANNKEIIEVCGKEIDEAIKSICEKHKCQMIIVGEFRGNQVQTGIQIIKSE